VRGARLSAEHDLDDGHRPGQVSQPEPSPHDAARARRNAAAWRGYAASATLVGPVDHSHDPRVQFRRVASPYERAGLTLLVLLNATTAALFISWLLLPAHIPGHGVVGFGNWQLGVARISFCVVIGVEVIRLVQNFAVWMFAFNASDPVPKALKSGWRVAMLTTIVPSREPLHVAERTLKAMLQVRYRGTVDVWILDEGDDPAVKAMAARLGVHHFSRKGLAQFNTAGGAFRAKTKSGNHNSWRAHHERDYDVVAQMDPDHVPLPCFLERTLGYFRDPDVAFVVAPQVYGNMYDNWVAHGASVQQYLFSGVVERGGNGLSAPLLIGTNHLYRPAAWRQIGGYQDSIIEDHLTSMRVQGTTNPATDNNWKGVYTPDVLAIGEAPASWTDYFNQQKRWSYGVWEILLKRKLRKGIRLSLSQRLMYGLVQFYYPSVGSTVLLGTVATSIYLLLGITALHVNGAAWVTLWSLNMATWFILWLWLRRFYLAEHERSELGIPGMLLALFAGPVYVAAAARALLGRRLKYVVTAKGKLRTDDSARTFALHTVWGSVAAVLMIISFRLHHDLVALRIWATLAVVVGAGPPAIASFGRLARVRADRAHQEIRDRHAWQRDMVEDFTSPDLIPLFELARLQSGALRPADGANEVLPSDRDRTRAAGAREGVAVAARGRRGAGSSDRAVRQRADREAVDWPSWPPVDDRRVPSRLGASGPAARANNDKKRGGSHRAVSREHRDVQVPGGNTAWYE
jgi:cellulose synthase (UDP-forming)